MRWIVGYYLAAAALMAVACAGPRAYVGPAAPPRVEVSSRLFWDTVSDPREPRWIMRYTGHMVNPTPRTITVWVDCPQFVHTMEVPPKAVQDFLVEPGDDGRVDCKFEER